MFVFGPVWQHLFRPNIRPNYSDEYSSETEFVLTLHEIDVVGLRGDSFLLFRPWATVRTSVRRNSILSLNIESEYFLLIMQTPLS